MKKGTLSQSSELRELLPTIFCHVVARLYACSPPSPPLEYIPEAGQKSISLSRDLNFCLRTILSNKTEFINFCNVSDIFFVIFLVSFEGIEKGAINSSYNLLYLRESPMLRGLRDGIRDLGTSGPEQHHLVRSAVHHVEKRFHADSRVTLKHKEDSFFICYLYSYAFPS